MSSVNNKNRKVEGKMEENHLCVFKRNLLRQGKRYVHEIHRA